MLKVFLIPMDVLQQEIILLTMKDLKIKGYSKQDLRVSLPKTGPLRFGSENQFPLNFAHEYILVQK